MRLLRLNADNYGELADYLEPAIREADAGASRSPRSFSNRCFTFKIDYNHDQVQENGKGEFRTPQH